MPWRPCVRTASSLGTAHSYVYAAPARADARERAPQTSPQTRPAFCGRWHGGSGRPPRPHAPPAGHQTLAHTQPHFRLSATPRPAAELDSRGYASPRARWPAVETGGRGPAASSDPDTTAAAGDPAPDRDPAWARATLAALVAAQAAQQGRLAEAARRRHLAPAWGAAAGEGGGAQGGQGRDSGLQQDGGVSGAPGGCRGCEEFDAIATWLPPAAGASLCPTR